MLGRVSGTEGAAWLFDNAALGLAIALLGGLFVWAWRRRPEKKRQAAANQEGVVAAERGRALAEC